jgi:hypothetical protein
MPSPAELHIDQALTDFSVAVSFQNESSFVARRAFPSVTSDKQSDRYYIYSSADLLRSDAEPYGGKGAVTRRDYRMSNATYFIQPWALAHDVGRHERANADAALNVEQDAAAVLMQDLMIAEDVAFAATAMVTGVWGTDVTGATNFTQWDDAASTPIEDATTGTTTVLQNTGRLPNKMVVGYQTWSSGLKNHPDILDRVKYTQTGIITENLVASVLGLDEVLVSSAVRNSAAEGLAASTNFIVGDDALLIHSPMATGLRQPAAGKTFTWNEYGPQGILTERFEVPEEGAFPRIQTFRAFDHVVTSSALGYFFDDCIA